MHKINHEYVIIYVDYDELSDGQMANYIAAKLSGDYGDWGLIEITYKCINCNNIVIVQVDGYQIDNTMEYNLKPRTQYDKISQGWKERVDNARECEITEKEIEEVERV